MAVDTILPSVSSLRRVGCSLNFSPSFSACSLFRYDQIKHWEQDKCWVISTLYHFKCQMNHRPTNNLAESCKFTPELIYHIGQKIIKWTVSTQQVCPNITTHSIRRNHWLCVTLDHSADFYALDTCWMHCRLCYFWMHSLRADRSFTYFLPYSVICRDSMEFCA